MMIHHSRNSGPKPINECAQLNTQDTKVILVRRHFDESTRVFEVSYCPSVQGTSPTAFSDHHKYDSFFEV